jgi:glycosyltransferase involved in cell wall biosynthesis
MKNTLYISYDGLSDPLGQSQIIPYLKFISNLDHKLHLLTFEKIDRLEDYNTNISHFISSKKINWLKLFFSKKNNRISRFIDWLKLFFFSLYLITKHKINIVHIRGFVPAVPILFISYLINFKIIYDSRGLWVDERIDNKSLNLEKFFDKKIFLILKKIEKKIFLKANVIVVLTRKAKKIVKQIDKSLNPVIIPCCADFNHFIKNNDQEHLKKFKKLNNIPINKKILLYSGSLRGVYLFDEMIEFFKKIHQKNNEYIFLILSNDYEYSKKIIKNHKVENIILLKANREEMPIFYNISDFLLCFINPTFARQCSSPTKIAEALSSNTPIICNKGVGDMDLIIRILKVGELIDLSNKNKITEFSEKINILSKKYDDLNIRDISRKYFHLEFAYKEYECIYNKFNIYEKKI